MNETIKQELTDFGLQLDGLTSTYSDQYQAEFTLQQMSDDVAEKFIEANKSQIDKDIESLTSNSLSENSMKVQLGEVKMAIQGFFNQLALHLKAIPNISEPPTFGD